MPRFERPRERRDSKSGPPRRRDSIRSFKGSPRGRRYSGREFSRDRHEVHMTKVTCSSCGKECEVPFKPTESKPVYCDNCFAKKGKVGSNRHSNRDLEVINEKLDKIMKALKIE